MASGNQDEDHNKKGNIVKAKSELEDEEFHNPYPCPAEWWS